MSVILAVYHPVGGQAREPGFPASDQHPEAVRYRVGDLSVDALGGEPTPEELQAVLNPPAPAPELTVADLAATLKAKGMVTDQEIGERIAARVEAAQTQLRVE